MRNDEVRQVIQSTGKKLEEIQRGLDDLKRRTTQLIERKFGSQSVDVRLQESATETQLDEAWAEVDEVWAREVKGKLAAFREEVILDELAKGAMRNDGMSLNEITFEVDRLLGPMCGKNAVNFLEDVAMAEALGHPIQKTQMLEWLRDYSPFPRRD